MYKILRNFLFLFDAELIHEFSVKFIKLFFNIPLTKTIIRRFFVVNHHSLEKKLFGLNKNLKKAFLNLFLKAFFFLRQQLMSNEAWSRAKERKYSFYFFSMQWNRKRVTVLHHAKCLLRCTCRSGWR